MFPAIEKQEPSPAENVTSTDTAASDPRLIVVSNRVAAVSGGGSGGLVVGVGEAVARTGGVWFGWSGKLDAAAHTRPPRLDQVGKVQRATIDLTPKERDGYYCGFANGCLWPALHYRLDLMRHRPADREVYARVNARFAAELEPLLKPGDLVWVHDFHLIPLAECLREQAWPEPIGFFLHTPFPSPEIFASIPGHRDLARGLMAYDLIGFQTHGDRRNFADYLARFSNGRPMGGGRVEAFGRGAVAAAFPIGINAAAVSRTAGQAARPGREGERRLGDLTQLVIGVDRLDYTKGIPERLRAFECLLDRSHEHRGKVTLLQVAPPTREGIAAYAELTEEVQRLVGRINGRFGTLDWTPITFINRPLPRETLLRLFRRTRVGLVTPLRDGMNLVAKEYVAAQDAADPGVLVLSQFAGAAEELTAAVTVNPHDVDTVAEALHRALSMPLAQRQARHQRLNAQVLCSDIGIWRSRFLQTLSARSHTGIGATDTYMVGAA